ncbi:hypothetical protein ANCCAN_05563 [Ancylostoma caninum]|uniref:Uncharacterized protein n=1 Tax=Ancylostoma caninum TaxID=29170 RepID=A0A368GZG6_ANCCA|nr:hypothetical protein ANCCAN_05563 [Ancylostoma caninum]
MSLIDAYPIQFAIPVNTIPPPQPPPPTPPPQFVLEPPTTPPPLFNSPEIQRVVTSLNTRTTAFSRPGQGYENVITILRALMERKSRVAYCSASKTPLMRM